ncbi:hypothetical protein G1H11_23545 [Phytoactinopolyspora alkaliphila]|uniref:Uncharacterized protein n=1 Tax=Phytoactinopolyspora alkaliphila TaxID=1783498 RepID=A0A6N9YTZ6_9ACTN|nr:hypothetical protein [Phytoactinopolyspora alkaliphila]NED98279.1 hypothetical protein [Phytoactinopolyspora alkaliphila]
MFIDCDRCEMRNIACSDCVVNVLLGAGGNEFDGAEREAIGVLAEAGLVPPLRLTVVDRDGPEDQNEMKNLDETWPRGLPHMRSAG